MKNQLKEEAVKLFAIYPQIEKLHITSDKQAFTERANADAHAATLVDTKVHEFDREVAPAEDTETHSQEREELVKEYEQLFEKKPHHNAGIATLRQKIEDKKAELQKESIKKEK